MLRNAASIAIVLFGFMGSFAFADNASIKKDLGAEYDKFAKNYLAKDITSIEKQVTEDFKWKRLNGQVLGKKEAIATMKQEMAQVGKDTKITQKLNKVTAKGATVVVDAVGTVTMSAPGQDGKIHKMEAGGASIDTWVKTNSGWKMKGVEEKTMELKIDGKKINPSRLGQSAAGRVGAPIKK